MKEKEQANNVVRVVDQQVFIDASYLERVYGEEYLAHEYATVYFVDYIVIRQKKDKLAEDHLIDEDTQLIKLGRLKIYKEDRHYDLLSGEIELSAESKQIDGVTLIITDLLPEPDNQAEATNQQ